MFIGKALLLLQPHSVSLPFFFEQDEALPSNVYGDYVPLCKYHPYSVSACAFVTSIPLVRPFRVLHSVCSECFHSCLEESKYFPDAGANINLTI